MEQKFSKHIHKASQASQTKIFSIRCSCINIKQFLYFVNWYCFGTSSIMFHVFQDFRFALFRGRYKGSKCGAGSSISSRISRYINLKRKYSIVFVRHNYVHIQQFSIYTKLSKTRAFEKSVSFYCCIWRVSHLHYLYSFTMNKRHTLCLFAMKCITMCSDMNI